MNKRNGVVAGRFESPVSLEGLAGPATERIWLGRSLGEPIAFKRPLEGLKIIFLKTLHAAYAYTLSLVIT